MSTDKETRAHRFNRAVHEATVYNGATFGLVLGDVRKLVAAADDMPDDAEVTVQDAQAHYSRKEHILVKRLSVRAEAKIDD